MEAEVKRLEREKRILERRLKRAELLLTIQKSFGADGDHARPTARGGRERMKAAEEMAQAFGILPACEALEVSRATFYRHQKPKGPKGPPPRSKRALSEVERQAVLDVCHSEEFVDKAPRTIQAMLMDRGVYLCSSRTLYRILGEAQEVKERRNQALQRHIRRCS